MHILKNSNKTICMGAGGAFGRKRDNGYYYGNLGLLLTGDDENGYDLMIKTD